MSRLLAAIDTSPCAGPVLATARWILPLLDGELVLVHVTEADPAPARALAQTAGVALQELTGSPVETIVGAASAADVVALVIGARGAEDERTAGDTALAVITRVRRPVVVVPLGGPPRTRLHRILAPLEGTASSSAAIGQLVGLADRAGLELVVLHVHAAAAVPAFQDQPHHTIAAWEHEFAARYVDHGGRRRIVQHVGAAAGQVVPTAHEVRADLIALGWGQDLSAGRAQVIRQTLARSDLPVLLLPQG